VTARLSLGWVLVGILLCSPVAQGAKAKSVKTAAKPKSSAVSAAKILAAADQACTKEWLRGDITSARRRCGDLKPATSPVATYWRLALSDDPVELRKGLSAVALKEIEAEPRLLLLAGRYQFSRGETRELSDLSWLAAKRKLKGPEIDTLKHLSEGK
jgi:hypothetical protein